MTEKVTSVEKQIIQYLSLNRKQNTQRIQRGIGLEDKNYPTVRNAIERLKKKKHYVISTKGLSEKNVPINEYQLSTQGVIVALAINSENTLLKTLENYKMDSETLLLLKQLVSYLSTATAIKILRYAGTFASKYGKKVPEALAGAVTLNGLLGLGELTEKEKKEVAEAGKKVEKINACLKEMFEFYQKVGADAKGFLEGVKP
jgi:hypothetical protein